MAKTKYGLQWDDKVDELQIEMYMIRKGGKFVQDKKEYGEGLVHHYEQMRRILWPRLDSHRWHVAARDAICSHRVCVILGCGSSGKTHSAAWYSLCKYYCSPNDTLVLVSSTDIRGLELRVFGEIKSLHEEAQSKFPYLPGNLLDSKHAILTDDIEEDEVRDMRRGIIGIPCIQGGKFVGLKSWVGIKQKNVVLVADEANLMQSSFLSSFSNLDKNENFQAIILGNPSDIMDPLGRAAEPIDGWSNHMEPEKTCTWKTRFMNGIALNLVGTDSPNFDFPENEPTRYRYLISREKIANTLSFFPKDSFEYYSQCVGVMKVGTMARRVLSREVCSKFGALNDVIWNTPMLTRIAALDASYGGDRCVLTIGEFGEEVGGKTVISFKQQMIVPVSVKSDLIPEDQISLYCKDVCERHGIEPENFFHDSTGRGTLGTSLARIWSNKCNPVEFGGPATDRPVSLDLYISDSQTGVRRLKLCSEHFHKFVTELWFSVLYAIEAGQVRNLPQDAMEEGCMREWKKVRGDKIEVEPKALMKERMGRSPDLMDSAAILVEGARRRGFQISKLSNSERKSVRESTFAKDSKAFSNLIRSRQLKAA